MPHDAAAQGTRLSYVKCADGITRKMAPDIADKYVEMNEGSEIVRAGELPTTKEGEILGATKATVGELFNPDGTQKAETQPITSRTFYATDWTREEAINPAVGGVGAATSDAPNIQRQGTLDTGSSGETNTATAPRVRKPAAE